MDPEPQDRIHPSNPQKCLLVAAYFKHLRPVGSRISFPAVGVLSSKRLETIVHEVLATDLDNEEHAA